MASRIDSGLEVTAHTLVHAMIVRAQQIADQSETRVGLVYDLGEDRIVLVELDIDGVDDAVFFRIVTPQLGRTNQRTAVHAIAPSALTPGECWKGPSR